MEDNKINIEKNYSNTTIDYSLYKDEPEKLFIISQKYFNDNNFDQGINILENSIKLAENKFGGSNEIELTKFYNKYSAALLQKILLSNINTDNSTKKNKDTLNQIYVENDKIIKEKEIIDKKSEEEKILIDELTEIIREEIDDEDIVFANLNAANIILKKYLEKYDNKDPKTLDKKIIDYYFQLSDNYSLFASLEKINLDYNKAKYYYQLSIDIYKKYDKYSRNLAGLYFEQAQIMDFDPKNVLLSLYKSKIIMEYHLQKELDKQNISIKFDIDENELNINSLSYDNKIIFKNKILIGNEKIIKASENNDIIKEFIDLINNIDIKIEDVILELKEYDKYIKEKEESKSKEKPEKVLYCDKINKNEELSKICIISRKRIETFNDKDDIKMPEDIDTKEKIYN